MIAGPATAYDPERVERLRDYLSGLSSLSGPATQGQDLFRRHQSDLESVTPLELMELFHGQLLSGQTPEQIFLYLDKVINAVGHALRGQIFPQPAPGTFLHLLTAENFALEQRLGVIRNQLLAWKEALADHRNELLAAVQELSQIASHYEKIQNILFPLLEKKQERFHGLAILWALHDHARLTIKQTLASLQNPQAPAPAIRVDLGRMFFALQGLVNKEQWILFPLATALFSEPEWTDMLDQARDYEPALLPRDQYQAYFTIFESRESLAGQGQTTPELPGFPSASSFGAASETFLKTPTGNLTARQAAAIFNALPVDLSFVDADNKVAYFTRPKDRIFPRSPAVIGRDVDRCHPPASVHVVEKIITEFREGRRDTARFWIDLKGRKVLIEYFAVRDEAGEYLGVLEVSQDITEIQQLAGQQRLLDWE